MAATTIERQDVWEDAGATVMARITGTDAANITQADVSSITVKGFDLDGSTPDTAVYTPSALTVADVVWDTLQTDSRWTKDTTGYNFRHTIPATVCTTGGHRYRFEYLFTPASGEVYWLVYVLTAQAVRTS